MSSSIEKEILAFLFIQRILNTFTAALFTNNYLHLIEKSH
jgi:hypothetical protein